MLQTTFGVVIGLFVITQSVLINEKVADSKEQSDSKEESQQQISKPAVAHSSSLQINLDYQSYLVGEVIYHDAEDEKTPAKIKILPTLEKALKILFRQFISPNAP